MTSVGHLAEERMSLQQKFLSLHQRDDEDSVAVAAVEIEIVQCYRHHHDFSLPIAFHDSQLLYGMEVAFEGWIYDSRQSEAKLK